MSYTFLRLTTLYDTLLQDHYQGIDLTQFATYDDLLYNLLDQEYAISDAYERSFKKLYGIQSHIIVANDSRLQSTWAQENGVSLKGEALVLEQIQFYKPTVIMIDNLNLVNENFLKSLRKLPFVRVVFGHHCSPHDQQTLRSMNLLDFVISCSPQLTEEYKKAGLETTFLIYHAFDSSVLLKLKKTAANTSTIIFTGSLLAGNDFHDTRRELIQYLCAEKINLTIYSDHPQYRLKKRLTYSIYNTLRGLIGENKVRGVFHKLGLDTNFEDLPFWNSLRHSLKAPQFGLHMYALLQNSQICLNNHGGVAGKYAANMRLFEATGVGTCLLTDDKQNMNELFIPDVECITYKNKQEAKEKIKWLLNNPTDLATITKAGQERCLRDHTYEARAKQLNEIISKYL